MKEIYSLPDDLYEEFIYFSVPENHITTTVTDPSDNNAYYQIIKPQTDIPKITEFPLEKFYVGDVVCEVINVQNVRAFQFYTALDVVSCQDIAHVEVSSSHPYQGLGEPKPDYFARVDLLPKNRIRKHHSQQDDTSGQV